MSTLNNETNRYSDKELEMFKILIEQKLEKAKKDMDFMWNQIQEITEGMVGEGDLMDDISNTSDIEMLQTMAHRHRHHIRDLENALLRVRNKTYGICVITGELIDNRRLMAAPTTTKSLAAKNAAANPPEKKETKPALASKSGQPKTITKVIRKSSVKAPVSSVEFSDDDDDDDFEEDIFMEEEDRLDDEIDLDSLPAESEDDSED